MGRKIRGFFLWLFAAVGFLVLSLVLLVASLAYYGYEPPAYELPKNIILSYDLADGLSERESIDGLSGFLESAPLSTRQAFQALRIAAEDPRVSAVVMRVDTVNMGLARVQELRESIRHLRDLGKKTYAYADTFGFESSGDNAYYLATAFDEIWMQPSGDWGLFGVLIQTPFMRELLDKIGIKPIFSAREEYKNAFSFLTEKTYQNAEKESLKKLIDGIFDQKLDAIADDRKMPVGDLRQLSDQSPLSAGAALAKNLIDSAGYAPQLRNKILAVSGEGAAFVHLADYAESVALPADGVKVALIYGDGEIIRGKKTSGDHFKLSENIFADDMAQSLYAAAKDPDIKALIVRIDSPGGSYLASDTVWNAIQEAKKSGKPVYAVMGDTAASGGYFIAMAADKIFASPGTITGSIGILGGKISVDELARKLGINIEKIATSKNADMWSMASDFSAEARQKLEEFLDRSYDDFIKKVALARNLPLETARNAAKGRVWSGQQALELGLIDSIGGWADAEQTLAETLDLKDRQTIEFVVYPKALPPVEEFLRQLSGIAGGIEADSHLSIATLLGGLVASFDGANARNATIQSRMDWIIR